jgi:hypothetical protein
MPKLQARNGSTARDIARTHSRRIVQTLLEDYAQFEAVACCLAAAHLRLLSPALPYSAASGVRALSTARAAVCEGLQLAQRMMMLSSSGCVLVLIVRMTRRQEVTKAWRAGRLMSLLAQRCGGGSLARRLLRQRAQGVMAKAAWRHAHEENAVGGVERCYGD